MSKNLILIGYTCLGMLCATTLNACTNPVSEAGTVNTYYEGTITGIEAIDIANKKNDNTSNTILGAVGGALLGNLISKNSTHCRRRGIRSLSSRFRIKIHGQT